MYEKIIDRESRRLHPFCIEDLLAKFRDRLHEENGEAPSDEEIRNDERFQAEYDHFLPIPNHRIETRRLKQSGGSHITRAEFLNAYAAVCFANEVGVVMNAALTVNPACLGTLSQEVERTYQHLAELIRKRSGVALKKAGKTAERCGFGTPLITVFENDSKGRLHFHIALSIERSDTEAFRSWLQGFLLQHSKCSKLPPGTFRLIVRKKDCVISQWRWFAYMFKSLDPEWEIAKRNFGRLQPGGQMMIKRVRVSQNIGEKHRRNTGWQKSSFEWKDSFSYGEMWTDKYYNRRMITEEESEVAKLIRSMGELLK